MSARITAPEPKVGQIWVSNDRRDIGYERPVLEVDERYVKLGGITTTRVLRDRMRPTANGYRFVREGAA